MEENKEIIQEKKEEVKQETLVEEKEFYQRVEIKDIDDFVEKAKTNQETFTKEYKKVKRISTIAMFALMTLVLVCLIVFGGNGTFIAIALIIVVLYFVALSVFSKKIKAKLNGDSLRVLKEYFINLDSLILNNGLIEEAVFNYEVKLPEETFKDLKICKDISHVGGRDLIKGKFKGVNFIAGDNLIKTTEIKDEKSQEFIVFLGKLFVFDLPLLSEGRALIYLKGKGANGPTDLDGLTKVEGLLSDKFDVYANTDLSQIIDEIKEKLEKFEISDLLLDMFISITNNKIGFGFSYIDSVMSVPLLDPLRKEDIVQYKKDVDLMFELMDVLVK